ncbi:hypothetical protein [Brevundimonas sp.]|uniref:hypothetical protein n=1 Tax=Brevundimonas sp. TaxID=1871086 RepID=UPI002D486A02|nr:hypothetical protein [Brevundimonas sp.]HYC99034.1 hypothetical protein [Brevundimonas sp.]
MTRTPAITRPPVRPKARSGSRFAPDDVWAAVRRDYLGGLSAVECCIRHGVRMGTLRHRAARHGWRRVDLPWVPPARLDAQDEGVELEERSGGDLDRIEMRELSFVAHRRMMRAALRGDAAEALRWRRVRLAMDQEEEEVQRFVCREDYLLARREAPDPGPPAGAAGSDGSDCSDDSDPVFRPAATVSPRP